jgi:hypothetical protein
LLIDDEIKTRLQSLNLSDPVVSTALAGFLAEALFRCGVPIEESDVAQLLALFAHCLSNRFEVAEANYSDCAAQVLRPN